MRNTAWETWIMSATPARGMELPSHRVRRDLVRRIEAGEWQPGEMLPTVAELARHYECSRGTVASVLHALNEDAGLVVVVPRWGVFRAWSDG